MRGLYLGYDGKIPAGTLFQLSCNSPDGVLCAKLEWLRWDIQETSNTLPFFRLFLSPRLKRVALYNSSVFGEAQLTGLVQIVSVLPTSLEGLTIMCGLEEEKYLKDAISTFICRCGSSLRDFCSRVPLSETAIHRITQLPNLRSWTIVQGPPRIVPPSIFPSLKELRLLEQAALKWLPLFASHEGAILQNDFTPATSHADTRETLRFLTCLNDTPLDSTLLSSILKFRNLVTLYINTYCSEEEGCVFRLTDDGMGDLAAALPRLKCLQLGRPCCSSSCNTTVASLLSISTHCLDLTVLETHFNTLTIVGDMEHLLGKGLGRNKAKCELRNFVVGYSPLEVGGEDIDIVVTGFKFIFPCLTDFTDYGGHWRRLSSKL